MLSEKSAELGRMIGQSAEYQTLRRANDALGEDKEVVAALQRMEGLRHEAQVMVERGQQPTPEMEAELDTLLSKVQANSLYQRLAAANENFDKVMYQVNQWIHDGIKRGATSSIITLG